MRWILILVFSGFSFSLQAQLFEKLPKLKFSGYLETYYMYDYSNPNPNELPNYLYSFNRHNEFNLNFGFLQAEYTDELIRGQFALMTGTYAEANLADEPDILQHIFRANVGIKLSKTQNLWLDMGIFDSHIGFESAIGADTWTLSRSLVAENTPYYLAGAKLTYETEEKDWLFSALVLNGWQRMRRQEGNSTPAFGHQIQYQLNERWLFNSSSFIGSDYPDEDRRMRYLHNFYAEYATGGIWSFVFGFDYGIEQQTKNSSSYHSWLAPTFISRFQFNEQHVAAVRLEYYYDPDEVIIANANNGIEKLGFSINYDYQLLVKLLLRLEYRCIHGLDFNNVQGNFSGEKFNQFVGTSLSLRI